MTDPIGRVGEPGLSALEGSMIVQVAKGLMSHDQKAHGVVLAVEPPWLPYYNQARAAIEAMREPTAKMVRDGGLVVPAIEYAQVGDYEQVPRDVWCAMINAALTSNEVEDVGRV